MWSRWAIHAFDQREDAQFCETEPADHPPGEFAQVMRPAPGRGCSPNARGRKVLGGAGAGQVFMKKRCFDEPFRPCRAVLKGPFPWAAAVPGRAWSTSIARPTLGKDAMGQFLRRPGSVVCRHP